MKILPVLLLFFVLACDNSQEKTFIKSESTNEIKISVKPILNLEQANKLAQLPLNCIAVEFPNKLGQTLANESELATPKTLHPAFYGCFDWHSAVHGHWSLVSLLKQFPGLEQREPIIQLLQKNLSKEHIEQEVTYFSKNHNKSYERTYGWAWLLKLAEELHTWDDPLARELEANLQPLTNVIIDLYVEFLPKLNYPIRVGEHTNTAFGLSFALDYAQIVHNTRLSELIQNSAKSFYQNDAACPIKWEPSGYDFLSPCLEEAALMKRVLDSTEFNSWLNNFMPQLFHADFNLAPGMVSDRTDGKLVHLDGLNFSRAWCLYTISEGNNELYHLNNIAQSHLSYSLPNIFEDSYEGGHWLGTFALYAFNSAK
jgi:hypothetical protein